MSKLLFLTLPIFMLACGKEHFDPKDKEAAKLWPIVEDIAHSLNELGFTIDLSDISIIVADDKKMEGHFKAVSRLSTNILPHGPVAHKDNHNSGRLAFYDPNLKIIAFKKNVSHRIGEGYIAHELAHVFQDQKWGFKKLWRNYHNSPSREQFNIANFLIEGFAELVKETFLQSKAKNKIKLKKLAVQLGKLTEHDCTPCLKERSLKNLPYSFGTRFLSKLYQRGGWSEVEKVFTHMPPSTEQIIHPNKLNLDSPVLPKLPVWQDNKYKPKLLVESTLGEAFLLNKLISLDLDASEALKSASGWDGDQAQSYITPNNESLLVWRITFDRVIDAKQLIDSLKHHIKDKEISRMGRTIDWIITNNKILLNKAREFFSSYPSSTRVEITDEASTLNQESMMKADEWTFKNPYFNPEAHIGARK